MTADELRLDAANAMLAKAHATIERDVRIDSLTGEEWLSLTDAAIAIVLEAAAGVAESLCADWIPDTEDTASVAVGKAIRNLGRTDHV